MRVLVNISERVEVELTEVGVQHWLKFREKYGDHWGLMGGNILRANIWELMAAFGPHMAVGIHSDMRNVFFKDNEFELLEIGRR